MREEKERAKRKRNLFPIIHQRRKEIKDQRRSAPVRHATRFSHTFRPFFLSWYDLSILSQCLSCLSATAFTAAGNEATFYSSHTVSYGRTCWQANMYPHVWQRLRIQYTTEDLDRHFSCLHNTTLASQTSEVFLLVTRLFLYPLMYV